GTLTRRYHGLLVAALEPPLGRTLLVAKIEDRVESGGSTHELSVNRWAGGTIAPSGHLALERFSLDGTTPVWTYACHEALVTRRVWMEPGANTTYVRYTLLRGPEPAVLDLGVLVNHRDYHGSTRGGWTMDVAPVEHGVKVTAFPGARSLRLLSGGATAAAAHAWYHGFHLARERERGLDALEDHLHAATFRASLSPGQSVTLVLSNESEPSLDGEAAWRRRVHYDEGVVAGWRNAQPQSRTAPAWIERLIRAADQFVVRRATAEEPDGMTITTGRAEIARRILTTYARFVDRGMLPNRFPDAGNAPEYNTVDATLWYVEAIRAYHAATGDDGALKELWPVLEEIV